MDKNHYALNENLLMKHRDLYSVSPNRYFDGWQRRDTTKSVSNLRTSEVVNQFENQTREDITLKLMNSLMKELVQGGYVTFTEHMDPMTGKKVVEASMNVVGVPERYVNLQETSFEVDGQKFNNDELVEAVRQTYPEKLI